MQHTPIPTTILTGFLGSGKTTLLNALLASDNAEPILIIENEFGPINIDSHLLHKRQPIDIIELTNGCLCCNIRGELTEVLHSLWIKKSQGELAFQRLIIETTGLADPSPIIQTFFVDEQLRQYYQLDAVITLIDSEHAQTQLNQNRVAVSQVGFADRLLLTKLDRITTEQQHSLIARLRHINGKAQILPCQHGQIAKTAWLNLHAFNLSDELPTRNDNPIMLTEYKPQISCVDQTTSWHDPIQSFALNTGDVDLKQIGHFMTSLIEQYGNDMLRYKGIIAIHEQPQRLIVQGVHKVVGFDYGSDWQVDEIRQTAIVIIGRSLPIADIRQQFALMDTKIQ